MTTLEHFLSLAPVLPELLGREDCAIWAIDEEKFLIFDIYGRFNIKIKPGDALTPGGTPALALQTQQKIVRYVPRDVYGVPCHTIALPVPGGVIGVSLGVENEESLNNSLNDLDLAIEQIGLSGTQIADDATTIHDDMTAIMKTVHDTNEQLKEVDKIGEIMKGIADQSRLISLNALIESARAGEHGRTFAVVAKEMQKLSEETTRSIENVQNTLQTIHALFHSVNHSIVDAEEKLRTQSAASQEIASALEEISASVREIGLISKELV